MRTLSFALFLLCAGFAYAAGLVDPGKRSRDPLTEMIVRGAKTAFPLPVLTIHKEPQQDGSVKYLFVLDARRVPNAPAPVIQSYLLVSRDAPFHAVQQALRDASAEVARMVAQASSEQPGTPLLRPDLVSPNQ